MDLLRSWLLSPHSHTINITSAWNTFSLDLANFDASFTCKAETEQVLNGLIPFSWTMEDITPFPLQLGRGLMGCQQWWYLPLPGLTIILIHNHPHSLLLLCMEATCIVRRKTEEAYVPESTLGGKQAFCSRSNWDEYFTILSCWRLGIGCYSS